ncbi:MAG: hypothetical protein ACJ75S_08560 [Solirubrobacterales bacterium]
MTGPPPRQPAPTGPGTTAERERPIFDQSEIGPWRGRVRVTPLTGMDSRWGTTQFEILAEWTGPGLVGLPPVDGPVQASDSYMTSEGELAQAIAMAAVDVLRRGDAIETPDLRVLAQRFTRA